MAFIYILQCKDKTFYTGAALDLEKRLQEHTKGKAARYTRGRRPVLLVYYEEWENMNLALKREKQVQKLNRKQKEALIKNSKNQKSMD